MKVKLPKPFYTARVAEALSTLTNYVGDGYRITNEIKPVQSTGGSLVDDPDSVPKGPCLLEWVPDVSGITQPTPLATFNFAAPSGFKGWLAYRNLTSVEAQEVENILTQFTNPRITQNASTMVVVVINGANLKNIQRLVLIRANNLGDASLTAAHVFASESLVFAAINTTANNDLPLNATYHVWVQDSFGQEDLLIDALRDYPGHKTRHAVSPSKKMSVKPKK